MLIIDGSHGEGGGQVLRTALSLAAITGQPLRLENIRAKRKTPGLAAQHLTAVWAAAETCRADLTGDALGSTTLEFEPKQPPIADDYIFDVAAAREGGSAGSVSLVFQTIFPILSLAEGDSHVTLKGGTHVHWSPTFHYLHDVFLPMVRPLGFEADAELIAWGWYPAGGGEIALTIAARPEDDAPTLGTRWLERGPIEQVSGVAVASSLPSHIAQRMTDRAVNLLEDAGLPTNIQPERVRSTSPGAGIFLAAEYENSIAGFSAIGRKGYPSEKVAQDAVEPLLDFHASEAALDEHLADQLLLPLALSKATGTASVEGLSQHVLTNLWVIEQFLGPVARVDHRQRTISFMARESDNLPN